MQRHIAIIFAIALLAAGCSKKNSVEPGNEVTNKNMVVIKGVIPKNQLGKKSSGVSLSDAKTVLVFNSSGGYTLFTIGDTNFTAKALPGTACALVFLGSNNQFIGCLNAGGLNILPLVGLANNDSTVIDLSTLTLQGTLVVPANNPIGSIINLTQGEISRYQEFSSYFRSLSQNIDADNDGVPDLLVKKELYVSTMFTFKCGYYGVNTTPPSIQDTSSFAIDYVLRVSGDKLLIPTDTSIVMTGPGNGAYSDIQQSYYATGQDCFIAFFHRQSKLPFGDGVYTMTLDSKKYSLEYSNINAKYFLVLAEPTIHTDGNGRVTSITVQYKDLKGNGIIAENFVYQTQVTLNKGTKQLCQIGALWEGPEAKTNTELYTFVPKDSINIADVTSAQVTYLDLIGNAYNNCY